MLGSISEFKKKFENPILRSRDSYATDKEKERGEEMLKELLGLVNRSVSCVCVCASLCFMLLCMYVL